METSLKIGFAQFFSCCPKKLSCPKFGGGGGGGGGGAPPPRSPPRLPGPCAYEFNQIVKGLQTNVSHIEIDIVAVKEKQKSREEDCSLHMKDNAKFIDENITELQDKSFIWKATVAGKI